jgi:hypothetical protein
MSKYQRAFWTFLFFTLIGPFLGAIVAAIGAPFLMWANMGPFMAGDHPPFDWSNVPASSTLIPLLGQIAIMSYVWCAIPAAVTALTIVPHILRKGTAGWLESAVGSAVCLAAWVVVTGLQHNGILVYLCFAAAIVAWICWALLRRIGILPAAATTKSAGS